MFDNESLRNLCAGAIAGAVSRTLVSPLERLKILYQTQLMFDSTSSSPSLVRQSNQKYQGIFSALSKMLKEEGFINGFFRGNTVNVIRVIPYIGTQFVWYEII